VPSQKDYLFSLAYHALVHKDQIADDYKIRLCEMAKAADYEIEQDRCNTRDGLWNFLHEQWMVPNGYTFVRAVDPGVKYNPNP